MRSCRKSDEFPKTAHKWFLVINGEDISKCVIIVLGTRLTTIMEFEKLKREKDYLKD